MSNNPVICIVPNPLAPLRDRELVHAPCGKSINEHLLERGYISDTRDGFIRNTPFVVSLNGSAVCQRDWNTILRDDDCLMIQHIPLGGGGGSKILSVIVTAVLVAAAVFTGGATLAVAAMWGAAAGAAMALLTSLTPKPATPSSSLGREAASPTYSISAQSNSARLLESIPVWYGRMRGFPDLAAQPYTESSGNQTILYQLFCISQGDVDVERIQVENSDINSFGDIQYQLVKPGERVTLFPDNVITSEAVQGLELLGPNQEGYAVLGPYAVSPPGIKVNYIAVDIQLPNGLTYINDNGKYGPLSVSFLFRAQAIDDTGTPLGVPFNIVDETITLSTQTAQMFTFKVPVPEGRYRVDGQRITPRQDDGRYQSRVVWATLRGYAPSTGLYGNVTMLAVIMRASNNLNSSTSRKINVIGTRKLQSWDPVNGWKAEAPTQSIAWAFCDALRNAEYSVGWPTSKLNMAEIYRLDQLWASRGDKFNGIFDTTTTLWQAITQIARAGRAQPAYYAGMIDLLRDEPRTIPSQIFSPGNIVENSFKSSYKIGTGQTPDHVVIEFFDEEIWQSDTVPCVLPGSTALRPAKVTLFGVTNRDQAYREGMYMAAVNRDQRSRHKFTTAMEGILLQKGDMIKVSHDVPAWGQSGRVIGFNRTTGKITTSEPLEFTAASTHMITFRKKNGRADGPWTITRDPNAVAGVYTAFVGGTPDQRQQIFISDGIDVDLTQYVFGAANREAARLQVLSYAPDRDGKVTINCCDYVDSVHIADQGGDVPPPGPISELPGTQVGPIIDRVTLELTTTMGMQQIVATPAPGAVFYQFQYRSPGGSWVSAAEQSDPSLFVFLDEGRWEVRVRAIGAIPGPWASWVGDIQSTSLPLARLSAFSGETQLFAIKLNFSVAPESITIADKVEIWWSIGTQLANAAKLITVPAQVTSYTHAGLDPAQRVYYWARVIDTGGRIGPWFNGAQPISQITNSDARQILDALTGKIAETQLNAALLEKINTPDVDLDPVYAAISAESQARVDADTALTQQTNLALSKANDGYALAEDATTTIAKTNGDLAAMRTIKTQIDVAGRTYLAGIAIGVENGGTEVASQILLAASRVAIIDPNSGTLGYPFVFENGRLYLNSLFVSDATIMQALVGKTLSSVAVVGSGRWVNYPRKVDDYANGTSALYGPTTATVLSSSGLQVIDGTSLVVVLEAGDF